MVFSPDVYVAVDKYVDAGVNFGTNMSAHVAVLVSVPLCMQAVSFERRCKGYAWTRNRVQSTCAHAWCSAPPRCCKQYSRRHRCTQLQTGRIALFLHVISPFNLSSPFDLSSLSLLSRGNL